LTPKFKAKPKHTQLRGGTDQIFDSYSYSNIRICTKIRVVRIRIGLAIAQSRLYSPNTSSRRACCFYNLKKIS